MLHRDDIHAERGDAAENPETLKPGVAGFEARLLDRRDHKDHKRHEGGADKKNVIKSGPNRRELHERVGKRREKGG